jgi:hypothetical protein
MAEINQTGYNDSRQLNSLREFLVPSVPELLLWLMTSCILMLVANYHTIWAHLTNSASVNDVAYTPSISYLSNLFSSRYFAQATVMIVWAVIGSVAYMTVWSIQHFYFRVKEDVEESGYVKSVTVNEYWYTKLAKYGFLACNVFIFVVFLAAAAFVIMPFAFGLGASTIAAHTTINQYLYALYGVLILMVTLFCLRRLGHLVVYAFRTTIGQLD